MAKVGTESARPSYGCSKLTLISRDVDVVMCLKGSDDNDVHNHLVISDLVSIL